MLELSRFLHQVHWAVVLYGSLLTVLAVLGSRKLNIVLLPLYFAFIVYMTLMYREIGIGKMNLTLFWSYRLFMTSPGLRLEILNNIWLFVPLGAILFRLISKWYVVFVTVLISAAIEWSQYFLSVGLCELDDIVSNGLGGLIGVIICLLIRARIRARIRERGGDPQ